MAKIETYEKLFEDIKETIHAKIQDNRDADALCKIVARSKPAILYKYHDINRSVKAESMENNVEKLDRHKCGACFAIAFEKRLIITDDNKKYEAYREKLAILAAMTILTSFAKSEAKRQGNLKLLNHINENNGFIIPKPTKDRRTYSEIWAMGLRAAYTNEQEAKTALSVAIELFLIEKYNTELAGKLGF